MLIHYRHTDRHTDTHTHTHTLTHTYTHRHTTQLQAISANTQVEELACTAMMQ